MAKPIMLKVRLSECQMADAERLSKEAGLSVSEWARSRMFSDEPAITTADKLPPARRKVNSKLCRSCAKAGVAAWNCRQCSPHAAKAVAE